jgi:hypothetical protein
VGTLGMAIVEALQAAAAAVVLDKLLLIDIIEK